MNAAVKIIDDFSSSNESIEFPLDEHIDQSLCRDKFLEEILLPYKKKYEKYSDLVLKQSSLHHGIHTAEAMAILKLIQEQKTIEDFVEVVESDEQSFTLEEKEALFRQYNHSIQNAAIQYILLQMLNTIHICSNNWPGYIAIIPHRLFAWSVKNFLYRVHINQLYLEVLKRNMPSDVLDCFKFKIDCNECCRLIEVILDDLCNNEDLCTGAMQEIRCSYYDEYSEWLPQCGNIRDQREELVKELHVLNLQLQMVDENIRGRRLMNQSNVLEANDPIENRYRLRWTRTAMEETMYSRYLQNKHIEDELIKLKADMSVESHTFDSADNMYATQIEAYKTAIANWLERYDNDLEDVELQCNTTQISIQKVLDDLKYYSEQMQFFEKRIAQVRLEIKLEEELALEMDRQRLMAEAEKAAQKKNKNAKKTKKK